MIITKNKQNVNTILKIVFKKEISMDFGNVLPYPNKHYINASNVVYYYYINGFFGTNKAVEYINDIKARFYITYKNNITSIQHYNTTQQATYKLKHFQNLKSRAAQIVYNNNRFDASADYIFWAIKLYAEETIKETGIIVYDDLFNFAYTNFAPYVGNIKVAKDVATLKSKCRSIVNYYINKNYKTDEYKRKTKTEEEWILTRTENIKKLKQEQYKNTQTKILNFLNNTNIKTYIKPNGTYNKTAIAKELNITTKTLLKHLKALNKHKES